MIAAKSREVRCQVVVLPAEFDQMSHEEKRTTRPSELVPWADPYIASLVHKLQDEVREERRLLREASAMAQRVRSGRPAASGLRGELEAPYADDASEWGTEPMQATSPLALAVVG